MISFDIERKAPSRERVQQAKERAEYNLRHLRGRILKYAGIPALFLLPYCAYSLIEAYVQNRSSVSISVEVLIVLFLVLLSAVCSFEVYRAHLDGSSASDEDVAIQSGYAGATLIVGFIVAVLYLSDLLRVASLIAAFAVPFLIAKTIPHIPRMYRKQIESYRTVSPHSVAELKNFHPRIDAYIESVGNDSLLVEAEISKLKFFKRRCRFSDRSREKNLKAREHFLLEDDNAANK